jgi:hypothetical protein
MLYEQLLVLPNNCNKVSLIKCKPVWGYSSACMYYRCGIVTTWDITRYKIQLMLDYKLTYLSCWTTSSYQKAKKYAQNASNIGVRGLIFAFQYRNATVIYYV